MAEKLGIEMNGRFTELKGIGETPERLSIRVESEDFAGSNQFFAKQSRNKLHNEKFKANQKYLK